MNLSRLSLVMLLLFGMESCRPEKKDSTPVDMSKDPHSFSIPTEARVTHLSWKAEVNVDTKTINAVATWNIETSHDADLLTLDIKGLIIKDVFLDNTHKTEFRISERDNILGQALAILIKPETRKVNEFIGHGNSLNNLLSVYKNCDFTESHFSGFEKKYECMDWRSLRLIFK